MTDTSEHRGWEPNSEYSPHILDDPDYDLAEDEMEGGSSTPWVLAGLSALLIVGCFLLGKWLEPPRIVFSAPRPPEQINFVQQVLDTKSGKECPMLNPGLLSVSCLYVNGKERVIRPNYDEPACQREFQRRIKP